MIVAAGAVDAESFKGFVAEKEKIFFIAVDGGYAFLKEQDIIPALAVGDFDSLGYVPTDTRTVKHPVEKDKTDILLAIDEAIAAGFSQVYVFGAIGGDRLDHTIANMQMLAYAKKNGCNAIILDKNTCAFVITEALYISRSGLIADECIFFNAFDMQKIEPGRKYFSLLSYNNRTEGVSIKGCKYELDNAALNNDYPLGISNEINSDNVHITLENGMLLVILIS